MGQGVVVVLVIDEESHSNRAAVGIDLAVQQICVVHVIGHRNRTVKRQKNQLS